MVWFQEIWGTLPLQMGMWLTIQNFLARRNLDRYLHGFPCPSSRSGLKYTHGWLPLHFSEEKEPPNSVT